MKKIVSTVMVCAVLCTAAFSIHTAGKENTNPHQQEAVAAAYDSKELADYAEQIAILVNEERTANGLKPVKLSPKLSDAANTRAGELRKSFSHTRPDGTSCFTAMTELGITYRSAAENIAYGQRSPEGVMNAWMNSSGHRANILNKNMEYIGVGAVYSNGVYYWSQFFAVSDKLSDGAYIPGISAPAVTKPAVTTAVSSTSIKTTAPKATSTTVKTTVRTTTERRKPETTKLPETAEPNNTKPAETSAPSSTSIKCDKNDSCTTTVTKPQQGSCPDISEFFSGICPGSFSGKCNDESDGKCFDFGDLQDIFSNVCPGFKCFGYSSGCK